MSVVIDSAETSVYYAPQHLLTPPSDFMWPITFAFSGYNTTNS